MITKKNIPGKEKKKKKKNKKKKKANGSQPRKPMCVRLLTEGPKQS